MERGQKRGERGEKREWVEGSEEWMCGGAAGLLLENGNGLLAKIKPSSPACWAALFRLQALWGRDISCPMPYTATSRLHLRCLKAMATNNTNVLYKCREAVVYIALIRFILFGGVWIESCIISQLPALKIISAFSAIPLPQSPPEHLAESKRQISQGFKG